MKRIFAIFLVLSMVFAFSAIAEEDTVTLSFLRIGNDEPERNYWHWVIE